MEIFKKKNILFQNSSLLFYCLILIVIVVMASICKYHANSYLNILEDFFFLLYFAFGIFFV